MVKPRNLKQAGKLRNFEASRKTNENCLKQKLGTKIS